MDVQGQAHKPAWSGPGTCGTATEEPLDSDEDASEGEDELQRLAREVAENPEDPELQRQLEEDCARLKRKARRLSLRKQHLKSMLGAYRQKEQEFVAQMDAHMDEVERTEQELVHRIDALTASNQDMREASERRAQEIAQHTECLSEATKHCSESETRVQFLMDRILALLSAGATDPPQVKAVVDCRQREREVLRQAEEIRQQYNEVRQQNVELDARLTEEQSLSRRLSDQLAEVEERFSRVRPERCSGGTCGDAPAAQLRSSLLGAALPRLRSDDTALAAPAELLPQAEELHLPAMGDRQLPGEPGRRTPLRVVPEAEVPAGLDLDELREEGQGSAVVPCLPLDGMEPIAEDPPLHCSQPLAPYEGAVTNGGPACPLSASTCDAREEFQPSRASNGPRTATLPASRLSTEGMQLMEQKLREALDHASFECAVIRIETGVYDFGPSVRAEVRLTMDNEVVASREEDSSHFEPIDEFIRSVAQESRRPQGAYMDPARQDSGILGEPLPPPSRAPDGDSGEGFLAGAGAVSEPAAEPQVGQAVPAPAFPPQHASVATAVAAATGPQRSPRRHWQPSITACAAGSGGGAAASAPPLQPGPSSATPPPQRSSSGRSQQQQQQQQQQQLGASFRASRQQAEPSASSAAPARGRSGGGAVAVPPLQLHTAAVQPMLGPRGLGSSSTPERPRVPGVPPPTAGAAAAAALGAPLVSPRPQPSQKAAARPSPPRVLRGPSPAGHPARVGMTHSPRRQFTM